MEQGGRAAAYLPIAPREFGVPPLITLYDVRVRVNKFSKLVTDSSKVYMYSYLLIIIIDYFLLFFFLIK